jgi:hypothetical protein
VALLTLLLGVSGFIQPYRLKTVDLLFFLSHDNKAPNPSEGDLLSKAGLKIPGPRPREVREILNDFIL